VALAVLGAALIAGGLVAYRYSPNTGAKTVSAAGIAAGVVMWLAILFILPVSSKTGIN
jgi:drug/metabolite transporter (DMT)-like permease